MVFRFYIYKRCWIPDSNSIIRNIGYSEIFFIIFFSSRIILDLFSQNINDFYHYVNHQISSSFLFVLWHWLYRGMYPHINCTFYGVNLWIGLWWLAPLLTIFQLYIVATIYVVSSVLFIHLFVLWYSKYHLI